MFTDIVFDKNGYTDAELICSYLTYMNYTPTIWLHKACKYLKKIGFNLNSINVSEFIHVEEQACKQKYHVIKFKYDPKKSNPLLQSSVVNKAGIIRLCQAAKLFGYTADVAEKLLAYLSVDISAVLDEIKHIPPQHMQQQPTFIKKEVKAAAVVDDDDVDTDDESSRDSDLLLINVDAVDSSQFDIYFWRVAGKRPEEVILSSAFAAFCEVPTKQINRQIRQSASRGDLVEDVDFIRLDGGKALAFCELNEVHGEHLTQNERKRGLYLLTQVGVNNLSKYLKNEKAKVHSDVVSCSAAIIQDIMRNGSASSWLSDPQKMLDFLKRFIDEAAKLTDTNKMLSEKIATLAEEYCEREERLLDAYENATNTSKELLVCIQKVEVPRRFSLGLGSKLVGELKSALETMITKSLDDKVFRGGDDMPPHLISNWEIRMKYIPSVNEAVSTTFLKDRGHPKGEWLRKNEGNPDDSKIMTCSSCFREGMDKRQIEFFQEAVYSTTTDKNFHFSIGGMNFRVRKTDALLASFMRLFCKYHPEYIFDYSKKEIELKEKFRC